jgi:hypothetical protein
VYFRSPKTASPKAGSPDAAAPETASPKTLPLMATFTRILPYVLSWGVLAVLMIVGMHRLPFALYTPIDGEWAKWNVEAILKFGKVFDLSPYSMLAGMGSMYLPNLPWLNPGALALGAPLDEQTKSIVSYAVYACELAVTIVLLARSIGFSWLMATAGAQLYLYLLFPPFGSVFQIYNWYGLAPYFAHLTAALNAAAAVFLACGRARGSWRNTILCAAFLALFISGLLSAPFTFVFATPAYIVISAAVVLGRRPPRAEWAWKAAALLLCLIFFFGSGLLSYYLGTIATSGRTPTSAIAWDKLLSLRAWLELFENHPICQDPRLLLCIQDRGAWLDIAALLGAAVAVVTRRGDIRIAGAALIAYIALAHVYAYAYQVGWLGPAGVFSTHFVMLSCWAFICMFAVVPFFEPLRRLRLTTPAKATWPKVKELARFAARIAVAALLVVIVIRLLRHPYDTYRYGTAQLLTGVAAFAGLMLAVEMFLAYRRRTRAVSVSITRETVLRQAIALAVFPILALVHLSIGLRQQVATVRDPSLRNYLHDNASIEIGKPFRGYAATVWMDKYGEIGIGPTNTPLQHAKLYYYGREYFSARYGETFTEGDLWALNVPTFEEYGEWTSVQAHAFALRLLAPPGTTTHSNYLRIYMIDSDILRAAGVRYVLTDAEMLDQPAILRGSVAVPDSPRTPPVRLFELSNPNLGTYSPTRFIKATTAAEAVQLIRDNKHRLEEVAVVSADVPSTTAKTRDATMIVERDGLRVRATSDGTAHILLPVQFSHCLVVVNGAAARLARANLFQTLLSFDRAIDARLEFRFGLFADNSCRLRDGLDNKALGL